MTRWAPYGLLALLLLSVASHSIGCGPGRRSTAGPLQPASLVRAAPGSEHHQGELEERERAYLRAGLPPLVRPVLVHVEAVPGITPEVLPVGSPLPGANGAALSGGEVWVAHPRYLPHELLHAALMQAGGDGDPGHVGEAWGRTP